LWYGNDGTQFQRVHGPRFRREHSDVIQDDPLSKSQRAKRQCSVTHFQHIDINTLDLNSTGLVTRNALHIADPSAMHGHEDRSRDADLRILIGR
jgi:hypothetical protein